jgi:hypothetical protein
MASDIFVFRVRVAVARHILEKVNPECASWRDTNLQIASLERKVEKFRKRFDLTDAASVLGGEISKKKLKAMGEAHAKLNQQAKKLKASLNKTLEESFFKDYPDAEVTPRAVRRSVAGASQIFEKVVYEATQRYGESMAAVRRDFARHRRKKLKKKRRRLKS